MAASPPPGDVRIGVLALQGSFREHAAALRRLPGVAAAEVRTPAQLAACDGVIIPGGESTTMALVAERWGLVGPLREFAAGGRPVWGTCAGLIFLAARAAGQKDGGQALLGGLDATVSRNFFGAQVDSFEATLPDPPCLAPHAAAAGASGGFRAVFIRAPAVLEAGAGVETLAWYELSGEQVAAAAASRAAAGAPPPSRVAVAVRQGSLLATSFHPELTDDARWHALFAEGVRAAKAARGGAALLAPAPERAPLEGRVALPADMPVLAPGQRYC